MNLKTLEKNHAIHVLNISSMILAWGVSSYFFDGVVTNHAIKMMVDLMMSPVYFADFILNMFSNHTISGNFNLMFMVLWLTYALPITACYPILMVTNHEERDLKEWYLSKSGSAD